MGASFTITSSENCFLRNHHRDLQKVFIQKYLLNYEKHLSILLNFETSKGNSSMPRSTKKKKKRGKGKRPYYGQQSVSRVRLPIEGEVLGIAVQMLGGSRVRVQCMDGKMRLCRIRGKIVKRMWVREEDIVLVSPWPFQDARGDIVFRYRRAEADWLSRKGYLDMAEEF
jgi:translation initiation factor 1A